MRGEDPRSMAQLRSEVHRGFSYTEVGGRRVPCILVDRPAYDLISGAARGGLVRVGADADVIDDGMGHVFVELELNMPGRGQKKFLADASASIGFFELFAESTMLFVAPGEGQSALGLQFADRDGPAELLEKVKGALARGGPAGS